MSRAQMRFPQFPVRIRLGRGVHSNEVETCIRECATRLNYEHPEINVCYVVLDLVQDGDELCHARTWLILEITHGTFAAGADTHHKNALMAIRNAFATMRESLESFQRMT